MLRTMHTASNTLGQLQQQLDIIGNNIANVDTHGFKSQQANFRELLYQQHINDKLDRAPRQSPVGIRYGVGAHVAQSKMNRSLGAFQQTDRSLDFVLENKRHYFAIEHRTERAGGVDLYETVFTRKGNFYASPNGDGTATLVDEEGRHILDRNEQAIIFRENVHDFSVTSDGTLQVQYDDGTADDFDMLIVEIDRPDFLRKMAGGYLGLPDGFDGNLAEAFDLLGILHPPGETVGVQQGMLEKSNVRLEDELTEMISTQRLYQMNSRAVTLADQMLGIVNNIR